MTSILDIHMNPDTNDAGANTIRGYLVALLAELWEKGEGFSGKRPFGNSGWEHELYRALADDGEIEANYYTYDDGFVEVDGYDTVKGNRLIARAIRDLL